MALRAQEREGGLSSAQTRAGCRKLSEQALKPGQVPLFFFFSYKGHLSRCTPFLEGEACEQGP